MIPNISPKLFSFSAVAIGYLLIDDATASEQNALGNWLMLVAQVLSTNAYYKALMQERGLDTDNISKTGKNNAYTFSKNNKYNNFKYDEECKDTIVMLEKMIKAIEKELNNIKSRVN